MRKRLVVHKTESVPKAAGFALRKVPFKTEVSITLPSGKVVTTPAWVHGSLAGHRCILNPGVVTNERKYQITHLPSGMVASHQAVYLSIPDLKAALVRLETLLDWTQDEDGIKRQAKMIENFGEKLKAALYG